MKVSKRDLLMLAALFAVAGVFLVAASIAVVRGNFKQISTRGPYQEKSFSVKASEINGIVLNSSDQKVEIVKSTDDMVHLQYYDRENEKYTIGVSNGKLSIDLKGDTKWYNHIGIDFYGGVTFKLAVPDDMACDFSIKTSNSKITAGSLSEKGSLSLKTSNGNIGLSNIKVSGSIVAVTSNGAVTLTHLSSDGSVSATTSNGKISLSQSTAKGSATAVTSNGGITMTKVSASSAVMNSSNGKLTLTDLDCRETINADTSNDKIQVNNISAGTTIRLSSSNGDINGTIRDSLRNFTVKSSTSNGTNSLPQSLPGGSKNLNVKTSNGSIRVKFSDQ